MNTLDLSHMKCILGGLTASANANIAGITVNGSANVQLPSMSSPTKPIGTGPAKPTPMPTPMPSIPSLPMTTAK